eukprot:scaffold49325_cov61-Cyclotella_meneghiniana.AAC.4
MTEVLALRSLWVSANFSWYPRGNARKRPQLARTRSDVTGESVEGLGQSRPGAFADGGSMLPEPSGLVSFS